MKLIIIITNLISAISFCEISDKGDAQAVVTVPQCYISVLQWKPGCSRGNIEAVQHKTEGSEFRVPVLAGTTAVTMIISLVVSGITGLHQ